MSILKDIFCKEKVRVLPVEIKENDYMTAVENNTRKIYGDKFSQYGYIYKNSIVIYQVERFAEQDSQTQMTALLFEVQFFAHTMYPPYNVSIDCEIKKKKQSSTDDQITMFQLQPVVVLNEITRKFYDRNPIYISVNAKTTDIEEQEKYKKGDKVKASIYMGVPWVMRDKCSYTCSGMIQGIKTDAYLYKKIENYEQKYIEKKNKLLGQKKKQRNNQVNIEEGQYQEQNNLDEIELENIDSESEQSESDNKKNKEDSKKKMDQEQKKKKKTVRIYTEDQDQESGEEYDTEEEEEEEDEDQEEGEEEEDLNEYVLDEEDEDGDDNEKEEEPEAEEEVE